MAKTALNFEDFNGVIGAEGAPTMAVVTAGSFTNHRGGVRTESMLGPRYGVMRNQTLERRWTIATTGIFTLEGKVRIRKIGDTTGSGINYMWGATRNSDSLQILIMGHHGSGKWTTFDYINGTTESTVDITIGAVYDYVMTLNQGGGVITAYKFEVRLEGAASWTTIISRTSQSLAASDRLQLLNTTNQGATRWIGHLSAFGSAQLAAMSESIDPWPTLVVAWATGLDFYMGPQTGAAANDGSSQTQQFPMTTTALNDELKYGIGNSDRVWVDNSTAVWDIGANAINCDLKGASDVTLTFAGPRTNRKCHKDISGGQVTWVNTSGNIWEITEADCTKCVVWEDDTAMVHVPGANFAAVSATLEANPGRFYTDNTKVYIHATGSGNPNTNGKTYYRSRNRAIGGSNNLSALLITNTTGTTNIIGWGTQYTMYVDIDSDTTMNFRGCIYDVDAGCLGTLNLRDFRGDSTGKHYGAHVLAGVLSVNCYDHIVERGYAYGSAGSATAYADQSNDNTTTPTASYTRITVLSSSDAVFWTCHGVPGSALGRVASVTFDRVMATGKAFVNTDGTDGVAARATLVTFLRGMTGAITNDDSGGAVCNVSSATQSNGIKTDTTSVPIGSRCHHTLQYNTRNRRNRIPAVVR